MGFYLITGGCGFIGSHLADHLVAHGHGVRILDDLSTGRRAHAPAAAELWVGTITDPAVVRAALDGVDGCFHLAAIASVARSVEDWAGSHRVNLTGTIHVFEAARSAGVPVVYASSAAVYGDTPGERLAETAPTRPLTAYGADKLGGELHARVGGLIHGVPTLGLRFFNVYGPRQDPASPYSGVISIFAERLRTGQPITLHGDGRQSRDFVYVADVVRHLMAGLDRATVAAPVCNVCTGRGTTIRELAATLMEVAGRAVPVVHGPARPGDIRRSVGDPSLAARTLGVVAEVALPEGLRRTVEAGLVPVAGATSRLSGGTGRDKVAAERSTAER